MSPTPLVYPHLSNAVKKSSCSSRRNYPVANLQKPSSPDKRRFEYWMLAVEQGQTATQELRKHSTYTSCKTWIREPDAVFEQSENINPCFIEC